MAQADYKIAQVFFKNYSAIKDFAHDFADQTKFSEMVKEIFEISQHIEYLFLPLIVGFFN